MMGEVEERNDGRSGGEKWCEKWMKEMMEKWRRNHGDS